MLKTKYILGGNTHILSQNTTSNSFKIEKLFQFHFLFFGLKLFNFDAIKLTPFPNTFLHCSVEICHVDKGL